MKLSLSFDSPKGKIKAIASKSVAHRLLICAAFADAPTRILCEETNKDIEATAACLSALGASIQRNAPYYEVMPVSPENIIKGATLPCGESGSTLRFLLPVAAALGADCSFLLEGRLADRPLSPLREELESHGALSGIAKYSSSLSRIGSISDLCDARKSSRRAKASSICPPSISISATAS